MKNLNRSFVSIPKIKRILKYYTTLKILEKNNKPYILNAVIILDEHELAMTI